MHPPSVRGTSNVMRSATVIDIADMVVQGAQFLRELGISLRRFAFLVTTRANRTQTRMLLVLKLCKMLSHYCRGCIHPRHHGRLLAGSMNRTFALVLPIRSGSTSTSTTVTFMRDGTHLARRTISVRVWLAQQQATGPPFIGWVAFWTIY